jgi:hypothetical protein
MKEQLNQRDSDEEGEVPDERFYEVQSGASCKVEDITGVIYGGFSSRFWLSRKQINSLGDDEEPPFYAWECITL